MTRRITASIFLFLLFVAAAPAQLVQWQLTQVGACLGNPLTVNPSNANTVYASAGGAGVISVSHDRGRSWAPLGTVPGGGFIKSICVSPKDTLVMLAGQERSASPDRVLRSTDGGASWIETLAGDFSYYGVPIEFNAHHPDTVFTMMAATVYRSIDFGSTWTAVSTQAGFNTWCDAALRPDSANVMYVGDNTSGIWKTDDGGVTFRHVYVSVGEIPMISIDETDPAVAYATKFFGSGSGVIKTTDFGETWAEVGAFQGFTQCWGIAVDQSDHRRVVMGTYTTDLSRNGIYFSDDGGENWRRTTCGLNVPYSQNYGLLTLDSLDVVALQDEGIYALDRIDLRFYPRGTIAGALRDSVTLAPVKGVVQLTQTTCDSTRVFLAQADSTGVFSFDSMYVSDDLYSASYGMTVDPEIPYARQTIAPIHLGVAGVVLPIDLRHADVFIVGEDSEGHDPYYEDALSSLGVPYAFWNSVTRGSAPLGRGIEFQRHLVIYYTAGKQSPLSQQENQNLVSCLEAGCDLLITGQDLLERNPSADIFSTVLEVGFGGNASIVYNEGTPGEIFDGFSFFTNSNGADYPQSRDIITFSAPEVKPIFGYGTGGALGVAAVRRKFPPGHGNAVFMGFGFETINPRDKRIAVMDRILQYFADLLGVQETSGLLPLAPELRQNYPNPFNPSTTIEFALPAGTAVQLFITDLLGREVARLADGYLPPGTHARTWDGRASASGVYPVVLRAGSSTLFRKILLLR